MSYPLILMLLVCLPIARGMARRLCRMVGRVRPNFRGDIIPASVGLTHLVIGLVAYALSPLWSIETRSILPIFGVITLAFGLLGLADDLWGSRAIGGFRGHLRSLAKGKPTTGGLKLLGGGITALLAAWGLDGLSVAPLLIDAALIALAANALNLLDVRPGRAQFGFLVLALPVLLCGGSNAFLLLPPLASVAAEWRNDSRARAMMGDTGSNLLGALAGLAIAYMLPLWFRLLMVVALFALNLASERVSLTAVIDQTPWLRRLDRSLGIRD